MERSRKVSFIYIVILICVSLFTSCNKVDSSINKPIGEFIPVLRFSVASDVHIEDDEKSIKEEERLAKLFEISYKRSESNATNYNKLDAALFVGDFTNLGTLVSMQKFKRIIDDNIKNETELVVSLGNHEFFSDGDAVIGRYKEVFNKEVDEHFKINGFHFIKLSPNGEYFSDDKVNWLKKELSIASKDTPSLPIFVMQHQHIRNTVYGSTAWSVDNLYDVLKDYPQVVDFSGHSHFPIIDERSLWQGDFTAIGTGTLSYTEMGLNGVANEYIFPYGEEGDYKYLVPSGERDYAVFQIVEVDRLGNIRLIGYDLISNTELFTRYIYTPHLKDSFITNDMKKEESSILEFKVGSEIKVINEDDETTSLLIPQAECMNSIESYRADIYENGVLKNNCYALSGYIINPTPKDIKIRLGKLDITKEYIVKVYAVNAYGLCLKNPLIIEV